MSQRTTRDQEREALFMLRHGVPQRTIAEKLGISKSTVARLAATAKELRAPRGPRPTVVQPPQSTGPVVEPVAQSTRTVDDVIDSLTPSDWSLVVDYALDMLLGEIRARTDARAAVEATWPRCEACGSPRDPAST